MPLSSVQTFRCENPLSSAALFTWIQKPQFVRFQPWKYPLVDPGSWKCSVDGPKNIWTLWELMRNMFLDKQYIRRNLTVQLEQLPRDEFPVWRLLRLFRCRHIKHLSIRPWSKSFLCSIINYFPFVFWKRLFRLFSGEKFYLDVGRIKMWQWNGWNNNERQPVWTSFWFAHKLNFLLRRLHSQWVHLHTVCKFHKCLVLTEPCFL